MKFGYVSNDTANAYLARALSENHEGVGVMPKPEGFDNVHIKAMLDDDLDFVIIDKLGKHSASLSLELEDRNIKMFNGGSIQAMMQEDPDYMRKLGHRVGLPIGGDSQPHTNINLCVLASRKGVCGPAFLTESHDRLGPVRCPQSVLCSAVVIPEESKMYQDVCMKVGKIFASFSASGVANISVDVRKDELIITDLSLTPPDGFWALWLELYAGEDPLIVFHGLAHGKKFSYPVHSDKLSIAALLTVPPFPMTLLDVDYSAKPIFVDRTYKDLGSIYGVDLYNSSGVAEDGHQYHGGYGEILGWKVVTEDEVDALTILKREAERLDDQYIQVPYEFPGFDMAYVRGLLEKNSWLSVPATV